MEKELNDTKEELSKTKTEVLKLTEYIPHRHSFKNQNKKIKIERIVTKTIRRNEGK